MSNEMLSLYDYLGRAAGAELGKKVADAAANYEGKKVKFKTKHVSNPYYEGEVMMYPKWFLDGYFGNNDYDEDNIPFGD